jgi:2-oxoglutarate ferredoxin oxidoreductase subunit beta
VDTLLEKFVRPEKNPGTACRGCGLRVLHRQVLEAIDELQLGLADVVWGTGIGCTGRQTYATWKGDTFAGTHGRVYALATGLRLALPPEKRIVLTVGDGDAFTIGLLHLLNCARRNVDMTVIVGDNLGYQSTGGQYSMTTPQGSRTDSSPYGMWDQNLTQNGIDVLRIVKEAGATFVARHTVTEKRAPIESIKKALQNRGFSLVQLVYPCVTHFGAQALRTRDLKKIYQWFEERAVGPENQESGTSFRCGVLHDASNTRPEFSSSLREHVNSVQRRSLSVESN